LFTRLTLLIVVMLALCAGAFKLGGAAGSRTQGLEGILENHPISIALRHHEELGLNSDQVRHLEEMLGALNKEFAPFKAKAQDIHRRMEELQRSGSKDEAAAKALQREAEDLGSHLKPVFESFAQTAFEILTQEQREKLMRMVDAHSQDHGDSFLLMHLMEARERLGITPQQFTKLQFLQADFIRAFAPIREQVEMSMMEAHEKYAKAGKEPPAEFRERMEGLQRKVKELQNQFSERAVKEVLTPEQRARIQEMMRGDRAGHSGG
jgi:Spy/CpxP family protein refolding chaperone